MKCILWFSNKPLDGIFGKDIIQLKWFELWYCLYQNSTINFYFIICMYTSNENQFGWSAHNLYRSSISCFGIFTIILNNLFQVNSNKFYHLVTQSNVIIAKMLTLENFEELNERLLASLKSKYYDLSTWRDKIPPRILFWLTNIRIKPLYHQWIQSKLILQWSE